MSEKAGTATLLKLVVKPDAWVVPGVGLWQVPHPMALNRELPADIDDALTLDPFSTTPPVGGGATVLLGLAA